MKSQTELQSALESVISAAQGVVYAHDQIRRGNTLPEGTPGIDIVEILRTSLETLHNLHYPPPQVPDEAIQAALNKIWPSMRAGVEYLRDR